MADNFGLKIGVEGEKEFKNSLRDINSAFKVLASEMKLVSAQFDKQDKSVQAMSSRNAVLNKEIDLQKDKISMLRDALKNATESFGENDKRTQQWAIQLNNAQAELIGMEKELDANNDALDEANKNFDKAGKEAGEFGEEVDEAGDELQDAGKNADKFGDEIEDAGSKSEKSGGKMEKLGSIVKGIGAALGAAIAALGAAVGVAASKINETVEVYANFEDSMMQVAATMGMSTEEIQNGSESYKLLEQAAKDAGASTKFTASEAAEALNYLALAGYDAEKAAATLPGVLNLAAAGGMDLAAASDLVTDAMSALQMETSEINVFMDQMARTSQKSNTNVQQLGEGMLVVAGTATSTGQELVTLNASLGVLADNGIKSSEGGTKLRNVLLSLASPTDKAKSELDALGVSVYDSEGNMRQLNEIMTDLNGALGTMSQEDRTNALYNIFNKTDLNAVNALLASTTGRFDELATSIGDSEGAAQTMADTMEGGLAGAQRSFSSAVEGMQIEIGSLFADMKKGVLQDSTEIIRTFTQNLQSAEGDWTKIGTAVGQMLKDFIDKAAQALPQIVQIGMDVVSMLGKAIIDNLPVLVEAASNIIIQLLEGIIAALPGLTEGALQLVLALVQGILDNLPALVEAAILMIATLAQGIGEALPELVPAIVQTVVMIVQTLLENLPLLLEAALQLIVGLAEGLLAALPELIAALPAIIAAILDFIIAAIPQIIDAGVQLFVALVGALPVIIAQIVAVIPQIISNLVTAIIQSIPMLIQAGVDLLISLVQALPEIVTQIVAAIPIIISGLLTAILGNIDKIVMAGVQLLVGLVTNLPRIIVEVVKAVPQIIAALVKGFMSSAGKIVEVGGNLIKGLWQGISDAGAWLWNQISGFFGGVVDKIKNFFGIKSPSKLFAEIGGNLGEGIGVGFVKAMDGVSDDMQNAIPTDFDVNGSMSVNGSAGVSGLAGASGPLVVVQQMIVRTEDDIRRVSQELYNLMETGSRAKGRLSPA